MKEEDDREEWIAGATASAAVVAHELICLSRPWKRVSWRRLLRPDNFINGGCGGDEKKEVEILQEEMGVLEQELAPLPGWGARRRRSRKLDDTICEEAAKELARASPATPFDFSAGSGASTSGGEDGCSGATATTTAAAADAATAAVMKRETIETVVKVGRSKRVQEDFRMPAAKQIRQPGKKKTIQELQLLEKSCLDERLLLQKELESRRRAHELLVEENQKLKRLKLFLLSKSVPPSGLEDKRSNQECENQCCDGFALPDLNEPWQEDFN